MKIGYGKSLETLFVQSNLWVKKKQRLHKFISKIKEEQIYFILLILNKGHTTSCLKNHEFGIKNISEVILKKKLSLEF